MKYLTVLLLSTQLCFAQDSVSLFKGQLAPFDGFLVPPATVEQFRVQEINLQLIQKTNNNLNIEIGDYQKRVDNYRNENDSLAKRLQDTNTGFFEKAGFFIIGAAITGLIGYGVYRSK